MNKHEAKCFHLENKVSIKRSICDPIGFTRIIIIKKQRYTYLISNAQNWMG